MGKQNISFRPRKGKKPINKGKNGRKLRAKLPNIIWMSRVIKRNKAHEANIFKIKLLRYSKQYAINPNYLMALFALETNETFDPKVKNKKGDAFGLIQFKEEGAKKAGTTLNVIKNAPISKQLDYAIVYLKKTATERHTTLQKAGKNIDSLYMLILFPMALYTDMKHTTVILSKKKNDPRIEKAYGKDILDKKWNPNSDRRKEIIKGYNRNKSISKNNDDVITIGEVHTRIMHYFNEGKKYRA